MIKEQIPISLPEVVEMVKESEKAEKIKLFAKEFTKMKAEKAKELKKKLEELDILKLNQTSIVSIVNFMPRDAQDLLKILVDVSLDQEEITKVLEAVNSK